MKKRGIVIILLLLLICMPSAFAIYAWSFRFEPHCTTCWEGFAANSSLIISNIGDQPMRVLKVSLKDSSDTVFYSSSTDTTIEPGSSTTFSLLMLLPPPSRGYTLFYKPCILLPDGEMCSDEHSRMLVKPLSDLECTDNYACAFNEICQNNKCRAIYCPGGYINHECSGNGQQYTLIFVAAAIVLIGIIVWIIIRRRQQGFNLRI